MRLIKMKLDIFHLFHFKVMIHVRTLAIACSMNHPPTYVTLQRMLTWANVPTTYVAQCISICHDGIRLSSKMGPYIVLCNAYGTAVRNLSDPCVLN